MRRRKLANGAIVATALLTLTGIGVAVASAATSQPGAIQAPSASAGPGASRAGASGSPTASTSATATASPSASSSSDGSECEKVYLVAKPAGDSVGNLCTAVTASGTSIDSVAVTFTASSSCSGSVMLRAAGVDQNHAEFAEIKTVSCSSGTATASFTPVSAVASDSFICGMVLSDKYTAAQACVAIS